MQKRVQYVIVGGGIAGVACMQEIRQICPSASVALITSDSVLKVATNVVRITSNLEQFDVREEAAETFGTDNLQIITDIVQDLDTQSKQIVLQSGTRLSYDKVCLCAGAAPKLFCQHSKVTYLRDVDSLEGFCRQMEKSRRIAVVGNGGIALELIGAVRGVEVVWVISHGHIGSAFFDSDAAFFLLADLPPSTRSASSEQRHEGSACADANCRKDSLTAGATSVLEVDGKLLGRGDSTPARGPEPELLHTAGHTTILGHAVGPQWTDRLPSGSGMPPHLVLEAHAFVTRVVSGDECWEAQQQPHTGSHVVQQAVGSAGAYGVATDSGGGTDSAADKDAWPIHVWLSNGRHYGCDLLVSATGVQPSTSWLPASLRRAADGGLLVDQLQRCSAAGSSTGQQHHGGGAAGVLCDDVFAAGDVCTRPWSAHRPHWFQMRLWDQARSMGRLAAHAMAGVENQLGADFSFELFTHAARFLGRKVVMLGRYNGQHVPDCEASQLQTLSRVTEGDSRTYVRIKLLHHRLIGALLIGETELEETFENLILDGLDLSAYGEHLLDPDFELDHIFD